MSVSLHSQYVTVSPYGGKTFRILVSDCEGNAVPATDIQRMEYTVYQESLGSRQPVTGHTAVAISPSCFLSSLQTSVHNEETYNFEHRISAVNVFPFAEINQKYVVVYTFYDTLGEPHPCEIICRTEVF